MSRRWIRRGLWLLLGIAVGLPVLALALLVGGLNTGPGQRWAASLAGQLTGGQVVVSGLSGRFPDALRLDHLEVYDSRGAWLIGDGVALNWSPMKLIHREALIDQLTAERIQVPRLPVSNPSAVPASTSSGGGFKLPVHVVARQVHADRVELGAALAGAAAVMALDGKADVASLSEGQADIMLKRLDSAGDYILRGEIDGQHLAATIAADEPQGGLLAQLASLPDLGALRIRASLDGPRAREATQIAIEAGPLRANARGTIDLDNNAADLDVTASAPAMAPRADVSWQSVALDAHVRGPFTKPAATGHLRLDGLTAAGSALRSLIADVQGDAGQVQVHAIAEGLRISGPHPDLLASAPLVLDLGARLDDPARPVTFKLAHPLLQAEGHAQTGGDLRADVQLGLPDLALVAALAGVDIQGRTVLRLRAARHDATTQLDMTGTLGITGGLVPLPGLVGDAATVALSAALTGSDLTITNVELAGRTLNAKASGTDLASVLDLTWQVALSDLTVLAPTVSGDVAARGHVNGPTTDLTVVADAAANIATAGVPRAPLTAHLEVNGLPGGPTGQIQASGTLDGAPLSLALSAQRAADGALHATIERADWRTAHAEGALTLTQGATLPTGRVALRVTRLDDLRPIVGLPIGGTVTADVDLGPDEVRLQADARGVGLPTARVSHATLTARVSDPLGRRVVTAQLAADGIEAGTVGGSFRAEVTGPQSALAVRATSSLRASGTDAKIATALVLDVPGKSVRLDQAQVDARGETLRLLAPARMTFANGVAVDRVRLGVRTATLDLAGRILPALDLTAALRLPADLARLAAPDLQLDGNITADAKLTGAPARPTGTVRLAATGLHARTGPERALPPANLTATAQLAGTSARIDARLAAGSAQLAVTGQAPLDPAGALGLRATGGIDLALLDPYLAAGGRRVRGLLALDATFAGTAASPRVTGAAQLSGGEVQDYGQGVRLTALAGTLRAEGDQVRIESLTGRAGPGTVSATGRIGVLAPGIPIDLAFALRDAQPLASERLTATLNADLTVRGQAQGALTAAGRIGIAHAEINIPENLPAGVAMLDVRRPGQRPPAPAAPGPAIALDLTVDAPGQIFVRGRGLDSELGGNLRVRGTAASPQVAGAFEMRRGTFSLAGTTLTFNRGRVGFDGAGLTNKIDPSLDFEADSTSGSVTAKLLVGGYASLPKITLSSTPELPQDEVLAYLLFKRSAKELGPFQIAEIASALASFSGAAPGLGNPLDRVRRGLGLDRLSVGGGSNGSAPSLEAGRYVRPGVYVGAKQGTSGGGTQATVQIDITKGLKLETDVGTGGGQSAQGAAGNGGSSVGLTYQYEY